MTLICDEFDVHFSDLKNLVYLDLTKTRGIRCLRDTTLPPHLHTLILNDTEITLSKWTSTLIRHKKLRHLDLSMNLIDPYVLYCLSKKLSQVTYLLLRGDLCVICSVMAIINILCLLSVSP